MTRRFTQAKVEESTAQQSTGSGLSPAKAVRKMRVVQLFREIERMSEI